MRKAIAQLLICSFLFAATAWAVNACAASFIEHDYQLTGLSHNHRHDHHAPEHSRKHNGMSNEHRVFWAMLLTGSFMLAEVIGGLISGSLALLADAGHMLTDFASLLLAWFAFRLSRRPADLERTYGYYRFEILCHFPKTTSAPVQ